MCNHLTGVHDRNTNLSLLSLSPLSLLAWPGGKASQRPVRGPPRWPQPHLPAGGVVGRAPAPGARPAALPHATERPAHPRLPQIPQGESFWDLEEDEFLVWF